MGKPTPCGFIFSLLARAFSFPTLNHHVCVAHVGRRRSPCSQKAHCCCKLQLEFNVVNAQNMSTKHLTVFNFVVCLSMSLASLLLAMLVHSTALPPATWPTLLPQTTPHQPKSPCTRLLKSIAGYVALILSPSEWNCPTLLSPNNDAAKFNQCSPALEP